jgi:hypothetical protein
MLLSLLVCDDGSYFIFFEGMMVGEKRDRELCGGAWFWWICERVVR